MERASGFQILSDKTLHQTTDPNLVAYCPSMDLVALVTTDQQVLIYRLNGQRVYGAAQKGGNLRVESIRWKPNGQLLAIAWSDGSVRLVSAESTKIVHQFNTDNQGSGITYLGWATNIANRMSSSLSPRNISPSWDDLLKRNGVDIQDKTKLDLPRDLSLIDFEISLPKLSVLATSGGSEEVFGSRSSLDALFRPFDPKDNDAVDVMVVGTEEGNIHLSIYDSFVIGSFSSPVIANNAPARLILHASHKKYSTHSLLMKSPRSDSLFFVPMDLRFISASSEYLSLLASRSTALQNLLRYIHQVQVLMVSEWKATQELPGRFLRNINETLAEKDNRDVVQALYHSVATGHTFPSVREWLVDELSERGHKRWDKAVVTGLENLKRLVHENMLPAVERCSVVLSRFAGIAKFQGSNDTVGFTNQQISQIADTVACLHLVSSKILIHVVDELDLFASFSTWLRYEIDRLASDSSSSNDDAAEREASIDHGKVLLYLQNAMTNSPLADYFSEPSPEDFTGGWSNSERGHPMFGLLEKELQKQENGLPFIRALPQVELLCQFLSRQANTIFGQIADAEKRNVLFGKSYVFGSAKGVDPTDMRMNEVEPSSCQTHVALVHRRRSSLVQVSRMRMAIENGISTVQSLDSSAINLGNGRVKDVKFLDSNMLLILWEFDGVTRLLTVPYELYQHQESSHAYHMKYSHVEFGEPPPLEFNNEEVVELFSKQMLPVEGTFIPDKMEVRTLNDKRHKGDMRRIVVLGKDNLHYKVLKFSDPESTDTRTDQDEDIFMT